ncbi:uncharacterized protein PV06_11062 [Exophiala oligosperma]|uniref:Uncharacterized protein n=1 Tax=Exophiala oligosperma TaxID=215243 RepID=A0A0D2A8X3_9EURO|nr:uncharacterized protein PV06_11062 [Exophiala oligosperma]KIW36776.1 hypothetical protein PV06_11062 [Exophiala oligosperma]
MVVGVESSRSLDFARREAIVTERGSPREGGGGGRPCRLQNPKGKIVACNLRGERDAILYPGSGSRRERRGAADFRSESQDPFAGIQKWNPPGCRRLWNPSWDGAYQGDCRRNQTVAARVRESVSGRLRRKVRRG